MTSSNMNGCNVYGCRNGCERCDPVRCRAKVGNERCLYRRAFLGAETCNIPAHRRQFAYTQGGAK